jgi:hypothetical protein
MAQAPKAGATWGGWAGGNTMTVRALLNSVQRAASVAVNGAALLMPYWLLPHRV